MLKLNIEYAIIGGSSTFATEFPEEAGAKEITVIEKNLTFSTPYGTSPPFKLFAYRDKNILTCKMHGWRAGVPRGKASKQIFWVFKEMGVKNILAEGGVGSVNTNLVPRDLVIPHDYIDFSSRRTVKLTDDYLLVMRDPFCPDIVKALSASVKNFLPYRNLFTEAVYCNTDGKHFESRAEVKMMAGWGTDIIGQSICPEVYLAREIGACYAGIHMVVNYAEGVVKDWEYEELQDIFYGEGKNIAKILLGALCNLFLMSKTCHCREMRKPTLLKSEAKNQETKINHSS